jgi:hypothetical protein
MTAQRQTMRICSDRHPRLLRGWPSAEHASVSRFNHLTLRGYYGQEGEEEDSEEGQKGSEEKEEVASTARVGFASPEPL